MRLDLHRLTLDGARRRAVPTAAPQAPAEPVEPAEAAGTDLDAELRELLLAEYAPPVLIVLPGAAFLIRPVRPRKPRRGG
jgi:hypothetical protein